MAKKMNVDFKKVLVEKGEKIGFYTALGLLVLFLILGGYVASTAASSSKIVADMEAKVKSVEQKTISGPSEAPPVDPVVFQKAKLSKIHFNEFVTKNPLFDPASNEFTKRRNPTILKLTEAQVQFIRGSIETMETIEDAEKGTLVATLTTREPTKNQRNLIQSVIKRNQHQKDRRTPPGGVPQPPQPPQGQPGAPRGGGKFGRGGGGPGMPAMGGGGDAQQTARTSETEVTYLPLDSKALENAKLAENILPKRMVVITGSIPYKKQLDEYAAALRANSPLDLPAEDLPLYRGYSVQRQVWSADGKDKLVDWTDVDINATFGQLHKKILEFEPELFTKDPALTPYFMRMVPDVSMKLVLPRPKLMRGQYEPLNLPTVDAALETLKKLGDNTEQLKNRVQQKLGADDPFDSSGLGGGSGNQPGGGGIVGPGGGNDSLPSIPGKGKMGRPILGGGTTGGMGRDNAVPEDAWIMRFIDVTVEPGFVYRYRIQLKAANPNYQHNVRELQMPKYAEDEEIKSQWYELPEPVNVPRDEFLYAAAEDERSRQVTEKLVQENPDVTYVQIQRWADFVRPLELSPRIEPIGDWLVTNIKAYRGQVIGEMTKLKLPLWSLTAGRFIFRDNAASNVRTSMFNVRPRNDSAWTIDFTPLPEVILVDFEGGSGTYVVNRKQVIDQCQVDMLMLTDDGKLTVRHSRADLDNAERRKREEDWKNWLTQVQGDTERFKNQTLPGLPPGGPPGGGGNNNTPNGSSSGR